MNLNKWLNNLQVKYHNKIKYFIFIFILLFLLFPSICYSIQGTNIVFVSNTLGFINTGIRFNYNYNIYKMLNISPYVQITNSYKSPQNTGYQYHCGIQLYGVKNNFLSGVTINYFGYKAPTFINNSFNTIFFIGYKIEPNFIILFNIHPNPNILKKDNDKISFDFCILKHIDINNILKLL